jgi:hypothetical protein
MRLLREGWATLRRSAAREKLPQSAAAMKASSWASSKMAPLRDIGVGYMLGEMTGEV